MAEEGYTAYAIDLLGSGYSSKPNPQCEESRKLVCGESNGRFANEEDTVKKNVQLGTANGGTRVAQEVDLKHPCNSPYNFYTWSEQLCDFTRDIVMPEARDKKKGVTLVSNSIGTISSLQSVLDDPTLFNGLFVVNPNFR